MYLKESAVIFTNKEFRKSLKIPRTLFNIVYFYNKIL